jgi:hypothetical protein
MGLRQRVYPLSRCTTRKASDDLTVTVFVNL